MMTMFLAYWLKCRGVFKTEDRNVFSNLVFTVTLPAMLVSSFSGITVDFWFIISFVLGLAINVIMVTAAVLASAHKSTEMKEIYTINGAGLNLGNIAIPFLSNFFPTAVPYLCMFDTGDSFFSLGTTYAFAQMRAGKKGKTGFGVIVSSLFHSIPFVVYVVMTLLSLLHITLPSPVLAMADFR